ncbi:MAG: FHA domain-containing protein [Deltaproteobacteria bacterium]|nr:FHA domain-containing protein [Deltaproteobacteria bacterium]
MSRPGTLGRWFLVGSSPSCSLVIDDPEVAPQHLQITMQTWDRTIIVKPLAPTRINGFVVDEPTTVTDKDELSIGRTAIQLYAVGAASPRRWWNVRDELTRPAPAKQTSPALSGSPTRPLPSPRPAFVPPPPMPEIIEQPARADPTEIALLAAIARAPADPAARLVYGDWLEQQGLAESAAFVRHQPGFVFTRQFLYGISTDWRAITSCGVVHCCGRYPCAGRWEMLDVTSDPRVRTCSACTRDVAYCGEYSDIHRAARDKVPFKLDEKLDIAAALEIYWPIEPFD